MLPQNRDSIIPLHFAFFFIVPVMPHRQCKWAFAAWPTQQKNGTFRDLPSEVSEAILKAAIPVSFALIAMTRKSRTSSFYKNFRNKKVK